jgi:hypothetical protein
MKYRCQSCGPEVCEITMSGVTMSAQRAPGKCPIGGSAPWVAVKEDSSSNSIPKTNARAIVFPQKLYETCRLNNLCGDFTDEEMKKALSTDGFLKNMWVHGAGVVDCYVDRYAIPKIQLSDTAEYRIV